ncbi:MAG: DinB family protein [Sediminibacterium sp.]
MNNKQSVIKLLNETNDQFNSYIKTLDKNQFESNPSNKWSAGQDLQHLVKVLKIVNIGFIVPKFILSILFGKNNNEIRSFETLRDTYSKALSHGAKSPAIYVPKPILFQGKENLLLSHVKLNASLIKKINNTSEFDLDKYRLPHPILGKVTLKELAIFSCFHTQHHLELLHKKIGQIV